MGRAEASALIYAPIDVVWYCLNDIDHTPEWVVGLANAAIKTTGPYGIGTIYVDTNKLGPFPQVTPWLVTVFEPMTRQVHVSQSKVLPTTMRLDLAPAVYYTRLRFTVEYQFLPNTGIIGRALEYLLMNRLLSQVIRQNLHNLNAYLSRRARAAQPAEQPA
ncbi:MAG: SRPBCC family protein [Anaerolineae bacterium]|nr:SRPBCC family protein [Anaerolineae bacterium]